MIEFYVTRDEVERKVSPIEWCIEWVDEGVDCTGEQPMYDPLGNPSKSFMFAASAIKYKMQNEQLSAELDALRAENNRLREALRQLVENASTVRVFVNDPTDGILSGALYDTILNAKEALK